MISAQAIIDNYARNVQIVRMQAKDLSHTDSLAQLPVRANCMNWLIGHVLTNRNSVLKLLGAEPAVDPAGLELYQREYEPISGDTPGVWQLDDLLAALDQAQAAVATAIAALTPEDFARESAFFGRRSMTIGEWLLFFYFHDTYHVGQTEIMRQAAGKDDKVI